MRIIKCDFCNNVIVNNQGVIIKGFTYSTGTEINKLDCCSDCYTELIKKTSGGI